tara:strand:- start:3625 stop:3867 length:243 start_codon:yes stop_codon:yes gene_type:complete
MQTKKDSLIETLFSVGTGAFIAFLLNLFFLPLFVDDIANRVLTTALLISVFYTSVSMTRSFIFRRIFTHLTERYKKSVYN